MRSRPRAGSDRRGKRVQQGTPQMQGLPSRHRLKRPRDVLQFDEGFKPLLVQFTEFVLARFVYGRGR